MKKIIISICVLATILFPFGQTGLSFAQNVGINGTGAAPDNSAMLDVVSTTTGLLIPRVALVATNSVTPVTSPATSLLVYNTATSGTSPYNVAPGYYYYDGTQWVHIATTLSTGNSWTTTGNAGTTAGTNYIGTNDVQDFVIKTSSLTSFPSEKARVTTQGYVGIGTSSPNEQLEITKNFRMPATGGSATGVIYSDGNPFIHNYGTNNTFLGKNSGNFTMSLSATGNVAIGVNTFTANTTGIENVAIGLSTLHKNTTGSYNVAIGSGAFKGNIDGNVNIAIGWGALESSTGGSDNIGIGYNTLKTNSTGIINTALGSLAMNSNQTGQENTALGYNSLAANISGSYNVAVGAGALQAADASYNTAIGYTALSLNTTGIYNTALGYYALGQNIAGSSNTAIGFATLYNAKGSFNTAVGDSAGPLLSTGTKNTIMGYGSLSAATVGSNNAALGYLALYGGSNGTAIGYMALTGANGGGNTALGANAAASLGSGANNTIIGFNADVSTATQSNSMALGYEARVASGNDVSIGSTSVTAWYFGRSSIASGVFQVGFNTANGNGAYLTGGGTWTNGSSKNYKDRFVKLDSRDILDKIAQMEVSGWHYRDTEEYHIGPFAEQFYDLFNTGINNTSISTIDPSGVALIGIQELSKRSKDQDAIIEKQKKQIEIMELKLRTLENQIKEILQAKK